MEDLLPFALLCFTSFFTLTNPLGTMPVFLTMTNGMNDHERKAIVRRATIVSFIFERLSHSWRLYYLQDRF